MHYANGRQALIGDKVVGKCYNTKGVVVGIMAQITPGTATCNCTIHMVGNPTRPVIEDYGQCDQFYHAEDAIAALQDLLSQPKQVTA